MTTVEAVAGIGAVAGADCQILNWQEQVAASESLLDAEILEVLSQATTWRTAS